MTSWAKCRGCGKYLEGCGPAEAFCVCGLEEIRVARQTGRIMPEARIGKTEIEGRPVYFVVDPRAGVTRAISPIPDSDSVWYAQFEKESWVAPDMPLPREWTWTYQASGLPALLEWLVAGGALALLAVGAPRDA